MFVQKVYYQPVADRLVLAGTTEGRAPVPGGSIDLPRELKGPGWVPIADVQTVPFADGLRTCVVLAYQVVEGAPLMEFSWLEGRILDTRPP
ncbi:MAG: hypothetical protein R3F59_29660 [Myxococcota bacterium]